MSKETHELSINSVPTWNKETKVPLDRFTTIKEATDAGHFKDEGAVLHAAYATRFVRVNRAFRDLLESEPVTTVESLRNIGNQLTYGERVAGAATGGKKVAEKVTEKLSAIMSAVKFTPEQLAALAAAGVQMPGATSAPSAPTAHAKK